MRVGIHIPNFPGSWNCVQELPVLKILGVGLVKIKEGMWIENFFDMIGIREG